MEEKLTKHFSILPTSPTPNGSLRVLPREIRDEIYGYVLGATPGNDYIFDANIKVKLQLTSAGKAQLLWNRASDYKIFGVSTRIRREAIEFFCSETLFCLGKFCYLGTIPRSRNDPITELSFAQCIMNVEISPYNGMSLKQSLSGISLFAGTEVLRNTFVIRCIRFHYCSRHILHPTLVEAVKHLTGFMNVIFEIMPRLIDARKDWYKWRKEERDAWLGADPHTVFNALTHALSQVLEPALGPSIQQSLAVYGQEVQHSHDIALVFHPRDYLSRKTQASKNLLNVQKEPSALWTQHV